jgi:hypothetical protein
VGATANVSASENAFSADAGIRLLQNATINQDAETSNRLHDNKGM